MKKWFFKYGWGAVVIVLYGLFYFVYFVVGINNPQPEPVDEPPYEQKNRFGQ